MFWRFGGYANVSTIDTLLDKSDTTLEELLDDSDLLDELRQHSAKLIEYLRGERVLKKLLDYIIAPSPRAAPAASSAALLEHGSQGQSQQASETPGEGGPEAAGSEAGTMEAGLSHDERERREKNRLRYANIACEIIVSETRSITDTLMENPQYLRDFWRFLERESPLDPYAATNFTRVNEMLLDKKTEEMVAFMTSTDNVVAKLLRHVDCPVIMDLLLKIVSLENIPGGQGIVDWLHSQNLIPALLSYLSSDYPSTVQTAAGDFLKAVITISANASQDDSTCIGPNSLTRQLVSEACISNLVKDMLRGGCALTVGVGVIIEVIRKNNSDYDPDVSLGANVLPSSRDPIYLGTLLRIFAQNIPALMALLSTKPEPSASGGLQGTAVGKRSLPIASGGMIEPLGFERFKTCELMAELLHCSNMALLNEPGSESYIRERDQERERLRAEGRLPRDRELRQDSEFIDDGTPFNSSMRSAADLATADYSLEESRRLEVANAGDEDGFEDIVISDDLEDDLVREDLGRRRNADEGESGGPFGGKRPPAEGHDDGSRTRRRSLVLDMPLTSSFPPMYDSHRSLSGEGNPTRSPSLTLRSPPLSPITSAITVQLDGTRLDSSLEETRHFEPSVSAGEDRKVAELTAPVPAQPASSASASGEPLSSSHSQQHQPAGSSKSLADSDPLSPRPEDHPAPLFSRSIDEPPLSSSLASNGEVTIEDNTGIDTSTGSLGTAFGDEGDSVRSTLTASNDMGIDSQLEAGRNSDNSPVVGDYLKMMFVGHRVVPTILDFFFRFPWNNFLHNVVYDVVQQVFNGPINRGYNRTLAIDLFTTGRVTEKVVEGQRRSDEAQARSSMRMGYMGHLTLIAEEVVKFTERHPPEFLSKAVLEMVMAESWVHYVEQVLAETRERDNAILGGVRPEVPPLEARQAAIQSLHAGQNLVFGNNHGSPSAALLNAGLTAGAGGGAAAAITAPGLDTAELIQGVGGSSSQNGAFGFGSGSLLADLSGAAHGGEVDDEDDDDEDDEDMAGNHRNEAGDRTQYRGEEANQAFNFHLMNSGSGPSSGENDSDIPRIPPPPPLNVPPSRARRQLAARLAMKSKASSEEGRSEGAQDSGGSVSNAAAGGEGGAGTGGAAEATGVSNQRVSSPPFGSHFPSGLSAMFDRARSAGDDDEDDDNDDDDDDDDDDDEAWMPRPPRHAENLHPSLSHSSDSSSDSDNDDDLDEDDDDDDDDEHRAFAVRHHSHSRGGSSASRASLRRRDEGRATTTARTAIEAEDDDDDGLADAAGYGNKHGGNGNDIRHDDYDDDDVDDDDRGYRGAEGSDEEEGEVVEFGGHDVDDDDDDDGGGDGSSGAGVGDGDGHDNDGMSSEDSGDLVDMELLLPPSAAAAATVAGNSGKSSGGGSNSSSTSKKSGSEGAGGGAIGGGGYGAGGGCGSGSADAGDAEILLDDSFGRRPLPASGVNAAKTAQVATSAPPAAPPAASVRTPTTPKAVAAAAPAPALHHGLVGS